MKRTAAATGAPATIGGLASGSSETRLDSDQATRTTSHRTLAALLLAGILAGCGGAPASTAAPNIGSYRVVWFSPACEVLGIGWVPASGASVPVPVPLPPGGVFVDLPSGKGFLNRVTGCDYTVRFVAAE